jgi:AcrR family transcriptional regulator
MRRGSPLVGDDQNTWIRMRQNHATRRAAASESAQRERVLAGMLAVVNADGYSGATVARVIARAGVSRLTFYEHFTDKDDCFLALYRDLSRQLLDQIGPAINNSPPERALETVALQLTKCAETEPAQAEFLASDALAGGPRARDERERTISQIPTSPRKQSSAPVSRSSRNAFGEASVISRNSAES